MAQGQTCLVHPPDGQTQPVVSTINPMPAVTEPYDVLIRVSAVALNPTDYRMPAYNPVPGAVLGCDFMGSVVEAGSQVTDWPPGTRLCGPCMVPTLVDDGQLKCHPIREVSGKWKGIVQGLEMLKAGQVRGQKLVERIRFAS
ncbi:hypothetical protein J3459_013006 [Metarhizium acridum]|nr:hypothetical protein J3459_013006 [Metarhizium acridum]